MMKYKFELLDDEADVLENLIHSEIKIKETDLAVSGELIGKTKSKQLNEEIKFLKRLQKKVLSNRKQLD